jgi:hypothetical protein
MQNVMIFNCDGAETIVDRLSSHLSGISVIRVPGAIPPRVSFGQAAGVVVIWSRAAELRGGFAPLPPHVVVICVDESALPDVYRNARFVVSLTGDVEADENALRSVARAVGNPAAKSPRPQVHTQQIVSTRAPRRVTLQPNAALAPAPTFKPSRAAPPPVPVSRARKAPAKWVSNTGMIMSASFLGTLTAVAAGLNVPAEMLSTVKLTEAIVSSARANEFVRHDDQARTQSLRASGVFAELLSAEDPQPISSMELQSLTAQLAQSEAHLASSRQWSDGAISRLEAIAAAGDAAVERPSVATNSVSPPSVVSSQTMAFSDTSAASGSDLAELRDRFVQVEPLAQPVDIVDGMLINAASSAADMEARPLSRLPI